MSGNQPPNFNVALTVPFNSGDPKVGVFYFGIEIANGDGSAPSMNTLPGTAAGAVVANTGQAWPNAPLPVAQYPYLGSITAAGTGTGVISLVSDGTVDDTFTTTVTQNGPQTASADPATFVTTPAV